MGIKHVKEVIEELQKNSLHPELIQDNKIHFSCDNAIYRVRMPSQLELLEADREKNAYQVKLIGQDNTITLSKLKKVLKEKQGVDIDDMEKQLVALEDDLQKVYERMAKKHDDDVDGIEQVRKELKEVEDKRGVLIREISDRTAPSIDVQSDNYYMSYLTAVCTEKNEETETNVVWNKAWVSFKEYLEGEDSNVKYFAMGYLTTLIMKVRS